MLPSSIGNLRNLLTLDLGDTRLTELPVEVLQLKKLRHLLLYRYVTEYTYGSFEAVYGFVAPHGIGGLRSLQKLYFIVADQITTVKELGNLTEMRSLGIVRLRRDYGAILCSSIQKMANLRALTVVSTAEDEILDLHYLPSAPQFLERLYLKGRLKRLPSWVESCYGLARVQLLWSKLKDEYDPLQPLQGLPNLIDIKLYQAYEGEGLHFKASGFRKLKILNLVELKGLRWIRIEEGSMSQLERILLENCDLLHELPIGIEHLKALECLELRNMSVELTAKLNPYLADGEYPKVAHIPEVWIGDSKAGAWKWILCKE